MQLGLHPDTKNELPRTPLRRSSALPRSDGTGILGQLRCCESQRLATQRSNARYQVAAFGPLRGPTGPRSRSWSRARWAACYRELRRIFLPRLYEKSSNTGETPRHEANHGSIYERLPARTQPLVIFAHPPLLVDPCQCPLHHPPPRQHHEALGGHELLPIYAYALLSPLPRPPHQHLFRGGLLRTLHELHAPAQSLLDPVGALVLSAVACVQPQVREAREPLLRLPQ